MAVLRARLLAIRAPGSIEARLGAVQAALFEAYGYASSVALPPLIPVAFVPGTTSGEAFLRAVERSAAAPWRVRTGGAAWEAGCLFFTVSSGALWGSLRGQAVAAAPGGSGPFPVHEGFYAGCVEADPAGRGEIAPSVPELTFTSAQLQLVELHSPRGAEDWWKDVAWEVIGQVPLRGRRTT